MFVIVYRKGFPKYYIGKKHGIPCVSPYIQDAKVYKHYVKAFQVLRNISFQRYEQYIGWSIEYVGGEKS